MEKREKRRKKNLTYYLSISPSSSPLLLMIFIISMQSKIKNDVKNIMEGKGGNSILSVVLLILSWFYGFGHRLRLNLYKIGILKTKSLPVPVISIGNITVGGTGKTPAVIMIAELLKETGRKVAVLSRGYKGKTAGEINIVSDGNKILMKPLESGDEPYMMASRLKGVPVITGADRYKTGMYAVEKFDAEVILLDDGYQHVQLKRNLNILLIDSNYPFGNGYLLPRGTLREPISYIDRADVIILTKARSQKSEVCKSRYVSEGFFDVNNNKTIALDEAKGKKGFAFCGIASPDSFKNSLKETGIDTRGFVSFEDHYQFTKEDIEGLINKARETGSEILVTTEKDAVRLMEFNTTPLSPPSQGGDEGEVFNLKNIAFPIWILKIKMEIFEGKEMLFSKIKEAIDSNF